MEEFSGGGDDQDGVFDDHDRNDGFFVMMLEKQTHDEERTVDHQQIHEQVDDKDSSARGNDGLWE